VKVCPVCSSSYADDVRFCPNDGQTLRAGAPQSDLVGQVIADRYHVVKKLGEGGMGQVYLAEHVKMGRRSAIKVMNPSMVHDPDAVARFNREASNASRITHPNVCAIYDFGETADGVIYLAMVARGLVEADHHGALPGNVLCLTFTNKATENLRLRVRAALATLALDEGEEPEIENYHGFAAQVLERHGMRIEIEPGQRINDGLERFRGDLNQANLRLVAVFANEFRVEGDRRRTGQLLAELGQLCFRRDVIILHARTSEPDKPPAGLPNLNGLASRRPSGLKATNLTELSWVIRATSLPVAVSQTLKLLS